MPDLTIEIMPMCKASHGPLVKQINGYLVTGLASERHRPECNCPAFTFGKKRPCKHVLKALDEICGWHSQYSEEVQTDKGVCPRCGGETINVPVGV